MSRPDLFTFRWSLFLCALLAVALGLVRIFAGPLPMDEAGLAYVSRWWILLEIPPMVYVCIRLFGIGEIESYADLRRLRNRSAFLIPVYAMTITGFIMSLGLGLWTFAGYAGAGLVMGGVFQAGSLILPPFAGWIARWKIWSALKHWLVDAA